MATPLQIVVFCLFFVIFVLTADDNITKIINVMNIKFHLLIAAGSSLNPSFATLADGDLLLMHRC